MDTTKQCTWLHDEWEDAWDTACGEKFQLTEGTPSENGMKYCCYCGGELKEKMNDNSNGEA
jgi:rRNA maturation endonuclease Nob1